MGGLERVQDFEQGSLVQGHRVVPLYRFLAGFCRDSRDGLSYVLRHAVGAQDLASTAESPYTAVPIRPVGTTGNRSRCTEPDRGRPPARGQ
jgi:hypothetical protein